MVARLQRIGSRRGRRDPGWTQAPDDDVVEVERPGGVVNVTRQPREPEMRELACRSRTVEVAGDHDGAGPCRFLGCDGPSLVTADTGGAAKDRLEMHRDDAHRAERCADGRRRGTPAHFPETVPVRQQHLARVLERPRREDGHAEVPS